MSVVFIEAVFKSSFLLAAAATANALLFRRTSAAARHLVWMLAVVGLLLLPVFSAALPTWEIAIPVATSIDPDMSASIRADQVSGPEIVAGARAALPAAVAATPKTPINSPATMLFALYVVGVFLLLIRLAVERWTIHRLAKRATEVSDPEWTRLLLACARRMGVRRPVRLMRSLERTMPMAFGSRRPAILIPSVADMWSENRRRAVLLHELAHVARRDCLAQLMAAVACAAYWIHPGVWWAARRLRVERELACDDRVLGAGTHAREYAEHLLELAYTLSGDRAPALAVSMARPRQVEGRMLAVLDAARNRATPAFRSHLAGVAIMGALLIPLAAAETTVVPVKTAPVRNVKGVNNESKPAGQSREAAVGQPRIPGTWEIRPSATAGLVHLRLNESGDSSYGSTIPAEQLEGLSSARLSTANGPVQFSIRRDAGTFSFEGTFRSGVGAGMYTFTPSASFPIEFAKRGFDRPTPADQYLLARDDMGFAFLDELAAQGYVRPNLPQLVGIARHGVDLSFLREMGRLGYRFGRVEALIAQRDHGVSPQYIRELRAQGLAALTADDLVRARDHGVSPQYVSELRNLGYAELSLDALISARDHGVSPEYVRDLRQLDYRFTLTELTKARDHGVSAEYIRELTALGYTRISLDELIRLRDHGVTPKEVRELKKIGNDHLTIDELVSLRDGVRSFSDRLRRVHDHVIRAIIHWTK
jgi:beta-lactamase regulating signal transducer with metallopeptidase domain